MSPERLGTSLLAHRLLQLSQRLTPIRNRGVQGPIQSMLMHDHHEVDLDKLPGSVRARIAQLDLELSEGDITEKGYWKKRNELVSKYIQIKQHQNAGRQRQRRFTRTENRYHSEVRHEAVQQALAQWTNEKDGLAPKPMRRRLSVKKKEPVTTRSSDSSSSDEDEEDLADYLAMEPRPADRLRLQNAPPPEAEKPAVAECRKRADPDSVRSNGHEPSEVLSDGTDSEEEEEEEEEEGLEPLVSVSPTPTPEPAQSAPADPSAADEPLPDDPQPPPPPRQESIARSEQAAAASPPAARAAQDGRRRCSAGQPEAAPAPAAPPRSSSCAAQDEPQQLYVNSLPHANGRRARPSAPSSSQASTADCEDYANALNQTKPIKISEKIQQLLLTLQRPRKKPLHEYYNDDDAELEDMAKIVDPNAPKPEGTLVIPARGEFPPDFQLQNGSTPRSIDSVLQKHAQTQPKSVAAMILDQSNKFSSSLTYSKLLSKATKVAYMLTTKHITTLNANGHKDKVPLCRTGDSIALIYPNTEPLAFLCAFYGCLLAGMVPVPVDVPTNRRDAGTQKFGFLLGSCGVNVALTSESCLKGLPKVGSAHGGHQTSASTSSQTSSGYATTTTGSGGSNGLVSPSGTLPSAASMAKDPNDVFEFRGWPKLHWLVTEHLPKPARDFTLPAFGSPDDTAYVEYSTDREGSVKGVCVSRQSMISHSRALTAVMSYGEGETMISTLDFKKDVGLWHVLAAVYSGMRVIFVPYALMKANPALWLTQVQRTQTSVVLAKSRDLHWSLMAATARDPKDVQLETVRAVVVADGANPWSLSACDQFLSVFAARGLRPNVMCPSAGAPETGTVALRRPAPPTAANAAPHAATGVLSMPALSHAVVRVADSKNALNSLTIQDSGAVIPGGIAVVVKMSGSPKVCRTDEVGEICLHAPSTANCYFGLKGISSQTFQVNPLSPDEKVLGAIRYVRSGLVGFLGPDGMVFVIGNRQSIMSVSGKQYSADDIIATTLSVEPMKFIYRGRIAVFSVPVLRDERIIVVAEQKQEVSEEDSFNWLIRVLQAVDTIHQVGIYCLALVGPNQLPKASLGGVHVAETRQRFLDGTLHPATLLMCPQNCVLNLPKAREPPQPNAVGPAAVFVGHIVQGVRIASAEGRALPPAPADEPRFLVDTLRMRAQQHPDHQLYSLVNAKGLEAETLTCGQLWKRAERIGALLLDKGHLNPGDHVALIFAPGLDLVCAFYGCLCVGLVPVCIRAPSPQNLHNSLITVRMVVDVSRSVALLSTAALIRLLKSKEASHRVSAKAWPTILDVNDTPSASVARRRQQQLGDQLQAARRPHDPCYLDFAVSTTGQLAGVLVTHDAAVQQCKSLKVACELYPSRDVVLCLDPYSGLGFSLWCLLGVYAGHKSTLIPPAELETNPALWLSTVSQHQARDTFCSYSVLNVCVRELAAQVAGLQERGVQLSSLRNCAVVAEERPRFALCQAFIRLFRPLGLSARAVSTTFGARVNAAICMQGAASPDPATVYVDARALRNDRVALVEKGAPHSIPLMECGKLLPGTRVVIAHPETRGQCADSHLGEIWVQAGHNAAGYFSVFDDPDRPHPHQPQPQGQQLHADHFRARLTTGDTNAQFARTGFLGFLRQTEAITADGGLHDAVFVVGALDETLMLRGMRYHPVDIETTVTRAHKRIVESAVFTWTHLLVVVAETDAPESEALDLVPAITSRVLEEQHLIVGVVMIVDAHTIPINSRGEKQCMHLRDSFLKDQLDPIYVAYNM